MIVDGVLYLLICRVVEYNVEGIIVIIVVGEVVDIVVGNVE